MTKLLHMGIVLKLLICTSSGTISAW